MTLLNRLFWSSRPISWVNTAFPFAAAYYFSRDQIDWLLVVGSIFFLIPYNLLMYGVNDVFDYESDLRNPRKGGLEGALLDPRFHKPVLLVSFGLAIPFVLILSFVNPISTIWLWLSIFMVIAYSLKGLRFKEIPFLDSVTSAAHFVTPAIVGLAMAKADLLQQHLVIALIAFMLWGMASHAFGAVQDVRADREAGIASIATKIGARVTVRFSVALYFVAGLLTLMLPDRFVWSALAALPYVFVVGRHWSITDETCESANVGWRRFIWLNFFAGAIICSLLVGANQ